MELPMIELGSLQAIDFVKYSGASGDFNEIHTVLPIALEKGFPNIIAHGMLLMGLCSEAIRIWFPKEKLQLFRVRFQEVVTPGTKLIAKGRIQQIPGNTRGKIELINWNGELKLSGYFELK